MKRYYTEEEANEILRRAVERKVHTGGMSRDQLEAIASEIGVTSDALDRAEAEWDTESSERDLRQAYHTERITKWRSDFFTYIATCVFLTLINRVVSPGFFWAIFPILGWGLGIVIDAIKVYHPYGEEYQKEFLKWIEKGAAKARKLEKRERRALKEDTGPEPYARP
jgi:hypothetical protein